ncbi:hypothetical protein E1I95_25855 [Phocaeicola dorei]|nr:hypothetical protein E1I95_25855 [Phocaeicola dorei]
MIGHSVYLSATRMDDFSKIPGAEYSRTNLMSRITSSFGKDNRWSVDAKVQYILSDATNRPISGARSGQLFLFHVHDAYFFGYKRV